MPLTGDAPRQPRRHRRAIVLLWFIPPSPPFTRLSAHPQTLFRRCEPTNDAPTSASAGRSERNPHPMTGEQRRHCTAGASAVCRREARPPPPPNTAVECVKPAHLPRLYCLALVRTLQPDHVEAPAEAAVVQQRPRPCGARCVVGLQAGGLRMPFFCTFFASVLPSVSFYCGNPWTILCHMQNIDEVGNANAFICTFLHRIFRSLNLHPPPPPGGLCVSCRVVVALFPPLRSPNDRAVAGYGRLP